MEERIENCMSENIALRSKLQAKSEALKILSKELDKSKTERDQFKLLAEQLQSRYATLKKNNSHSYNEPSCSQEGSVSQLLNDTQEQNKRLTLELESTKQLLTEARGDIAVLRKKLTTTKDKTSTALTEEAFPVHQREQFVEQLEKFSEKTSQMKADIQCLLDEKEELIKERDAFKHKAHRVSHELAVALSVRKNVESSSENGKVSASNVGFLLDADALISENRYLHDRLQQTEAEVQLVTQVLAKYKSMLESKRRKGIIKLGTTNTDMIMSQKQVKQLLEKSSTNELPITAATIADLKSLCLGLLETLGDKTLALSHQKKANKILASRVSELEAKLENLIGGKMSIFPSHILLQNYCSADADKQDISKELQALKLENEPYTPSSETPMKCNEPPPEPSSFIEEKLPLKLQIMVDKALNEIQNDASDL